MLDDEHQRNPPMTGDPWYAEMARQYRERNTKPQRNAPPSGPTPDDCNECYQWKFDLVDSDGNDRWIWFKVCSWDCPHTHHEKDVWIA